MSRLFLEITIGLLCERVAVDGVGARATAAADMPELARAADSLVIIRVLQRVEERVILIDVDDGILREASADDR